MVFEGTGNNDTCEIIKVEKTESHKFFICESSMWALDENINSSQGKSNGWWA